MHTFSLLFSSVLDEIRISLLMGQQLKNYFLPYLKIRVIKENIIQSKRQLVNTCIETVC